MTSIQINLIKHDGQQPYGPGDAVKGIVHLALFPDTAQAVNRIEVAFSGRTEIECGSHERRVPWPGNGRFVLFDEAQTICSYDRLNPPTFGETQWSFSFVFPSETSFDPQQHVRRWRTSADLPTALSEPGLPLPPSLDVYRQDWPAKSAPLVYGTTGGRASIIYELEARLVTTHGSYIRQVFSTVQFRPHTQLPTASPSFCMAERWFSAESRQLPSKNHKHSLLSGARSLLLKSLVTRFKLILETPLYATMGEALPIYLGVDYDLESSTAIDLPQVFLQSVKIGYIEQIELGPRQTSYMTGQSTTIQSLPSWRYIEFVYEKDKMIPVTERMALHRKLHSDKLVADKFSFETPNIRRFYHDFFVSVIVVCNGKSFTASSGMKGRDFVFLPPVAPSKDIELPDSRLMPPEAQSEPVHELESAHGINEMQGELVYELEGRV